MKSPTPPPISDQAAGEPSSADMYVWFAENKGNERDGERFIRAWTDDAGKVPALRDAIGKEPTIYRSTAPTTGSAPVADAREALTDAVVEKWLDRQGNDSGQGLCDMYTSAVRDGFRLARSTLTDFYATRGTAPGNSSAASIFAPEVPWWKVMELAEKHGKGWSQFSGWAFLNDDALHAFACEVAATAPMEKT